MSAPAAAELRREYEAGASVAEMMERHGLSRYMIEQRLILADTKMRPVGCVPGKKKKPMCDEGRKIPRGAHVALLADYDGGVRLQTVADRHGITRERVRQIALLYGRTMRRSGERKEAA